MTKEVQSNSRAQHPQDLLLPRAACRRPIPEQSLTAMQVDDALIKLEAVQRLTGMSRSTIYARMAAGKFVQPVRLSARSIRFRAGDITNWLRAQRVQA